MRLVDCVVQPFQADLDVAPLVRAELAAAIAAFRFKVGMIPLLLACSVAGVLYYLAASITPGLRPL